MSAAVHDEIKQMQADNAMLWNAVAAKNAEIARLRALLQAIVARDDTAGGLWDEDGGGPGDCFPIQSEELEAVLDAARAALKSAQ